LPPHAGLIEVSTDSTNVHAEAVPFLQSQSWSEKESEQTKKVAKHVFQKSHSYAPFWSKNAKLGCFAYLCGLSPLIYGSDVINNNI
jgi:hypothetical protein